MDTNNEYLEDIAGVGRGSKMTDNQLLETIASNSDSSGGHVTSVNGQSGTVVLRAESVADITNGGGSSIIDVEQKINELLASLRKAGLMEE